jgi:IPT/TIG domain
MRLTLFRPLTVSITLSLALVGCSGGGGGGGSTSPPPLTMTLSPTSLTFAATDAGTPAGQTVTASFSGTGSGTLYVLIVPADPGLISVGNVAITGTTSGQALVTPAAPTTAGAGKRSTTITVTACLNDATCKTNQIAGSPQTINVTYTVAGVGASTTSLSYTIGNSAVAADYSQTFNVSGYPTQTWTSAITDAPWLSLTPSTGSTAATVSVQATLDQAQVGALENGTYTGSITLSAPSGIGVTLPVTLTLARSKINFVAPYVGTSNKSDAVIIRGEHFGLVTPTAVNFGSTAASSFTVVSDTEIDATYPALPAGTYPVRIVASGAAVGTSRARLVIVDPLNSPSTTLLYGVSPLSFVTELVYDAERQALLVQFTDKNLQPPNELLRYAYGNGVWGTPIATNVPPVGDFALSIDGTQILSSGFDNSALTLNGQAVVQPLSPTTLLPLGAEVGSPAAAGFGVQSLAVANDGQAILETTNFVLSGENPILGYAELAGTMSVLPQTTTVVSNKAVVGASTDGATVLVVSNSLGVPNGPAVAKYDTSAGKLTQLNSFVQSGTISIDRHGSRLLLNATDVYDQNLILLGSLPGTTIGSVLSPDAHRAYTYDSSGTVRVFDLTAAPTAGLYPEITPAKSLPGSPVVSSSARLIVSPDGGTLFVAIQAVFVVPLP